MMETAELQSVAEEIKKLEKAVKCPFCGQQLKFKEYDWMFDPKIILQCEKCDIEFRLRKSSGFLETLGIVKPKWRLTSIRRG